MALAGMAVAVNVVAVPLARSGALPHELYGSPSVAVWSQVGLATGWSEERARSYCGEFAAGLADRWPAVARTRKTAFLRVVLLQTGRIEVDVMPLWVTIGDPGIGALQLETTVQAAMPALNPPVNERGFRMFLIAIAFDARPEEDAFFETLGAPQGRFTPSAGSKEDGAVEQPDAANEARASSAGWRGPRS
jgi:hypothetical protein